MSKLNQMIVNILEKRAIDILTQRNGLTAGDLGWELWGDGHVGGGEGSHRANKFCRPAGKLMKRLEAKGQTIRLQRGKCFVWYARHLEPSAQ